MAQNKPPVWLAQTEHKKKQCDKQEEERGRKVAKAAAAFFKQALQRAYGESIDYVVLATPGRSRTLRLPPLLPPFLPLSCTLAGHLRMLLKVCANNLSVSLIASRFCYKCLAGEFTTICVNNNNNNGSNCSLNLLLCSSQHVKFYAAVIAVLHATHTHTQWTAASLCAERELLENVYWTCTCNMRQAAAAAASSIHAYRYATYSLLRIPSCQQCQSTV